jgi:hypothetical protein
MKSADANGDPAPVEEPLESVRSFGHRWDRFWFSPSDPTTVGLIRLLSGFAILYVYFCYSFDLLSYVSPKEAWLDGSVSTELRKKYPVVVFPDDWPGRLAPGFKITDEALITFSTVLSSTGVPNEAVAKLHAKLLPLKDQDFPSPEDFSFALSRVLDREEIARFGESLHNVARNKVPMQVLYAEGKPAWSIFFHVEDPRWIWAVHVGILVVLLLFAIGYATRITSVLAFMGATCYIWRAQTSLFGMDSIVSVLLLYLMVAPSGAALSLDRWLEVRRERKRLGNPNAHVPLQPLVTATLATRLMQIHFCFIYLASGSAKLLGPGWWNGNALWACYANYSFAPLRVPLYYDFIVFLSQHRWLWEIVMSFGALFTLFTEIGFIFLVWLPRWRWFMLCCSVLLHTGIGLFMGLVTFSLMMLCLVLAFVPPEAARVFVGAVAENWQKVWRWITRSGTGAARPVPAAAR